MGTSDKKLKEPFFFFFIKTHTHTHQKTSNDLPQYWEGDMLIKYFLA